MGNQASNLEIAAVKPGEALGELVPLGSAHIIVSKVLLNIVVGSIGVGGADHDALLRGARSQEQYQVETEGKATVFASYNEPYE